MTAQESDRLKQAIVVLAYRYEGVPVGNVTDFFTRRLNEDGVRGMTDEEFEAWKRTMFAAKEN